MSKHTHQKGQHSVASFVRNNRTAELCRSSIIRLRAILYSTTPQKAGHCSSFFLSEDEAERKKSENDRRNLKENVNPKIEIYMTAKLDK